MGGYRSLPKPLAVSSRLAMLTKSHRFMTCGRLSVENTILERLAQHFEHMPLALGELIQKQHAMVGQRHLARQRHLAAADQAHVRHGVMGGATRARGDD